MAGKLGVLAMLLGLAFGAGPVGAAVADIERSEARDRAIAAGMKAVLTCGARFVAERTLADIERDEGSAIYPDYLEASARTAEPVVDAARRMVSVGFDEHLPPRVAVWRPGLGCTQLPIGATATGAAALPGARIDTTPPDRSAVPWPAGDLAVPEAPAALQAVAARAFDGAYYGADTRTTALLITTPEQLLIEAYRPDFGPFQLQRTWSIAKGFVSSLVGVAVSRGWLAVDEPLPVAEWSSALDPRRGITLDQALRMTSGLSSGGPHWRGDLVYFGGARIDETVTTANLDAAPGRRWRYSNIDTLLIMHALRQAVDDDQRYWDLPFEALFHRIGMYHTVPELDWGGTWVMSSQVWSTARDLARFGLLYLQDGVWQGERVLPEGWVDYVTTPGPAQPDNPVLGYGAQWWLLDAVHPGAYAAIGNRGQFVLVVPDRQLVVVRRSYDLPQGPQFDVGRFLRDVLAAVEGGETG